MSANKGKLYLIPLPISDAEEMHLPAYNHHLLGQISHFIVERVRTARRFIRRANDQLVIDELEFLEIDKHNRKQDFKPFLKKVEDGINIGLMSEAGLPAIADPGGRVVRQAHMLGIEVIPLVGPSSILLALMASGLNGQHFYFHGYLPRERKALEQKLRYIQGNAVRSGCTHIFIEAPYRNNRLLETILHVLDAHIQCGIASELISDKQMVYTKSIKDWRIGDKPDLHKKPAIFLIGR